MRLGAAGDPRNALPRLIANAFDQPAIHWTGPANGFGALMDETHTYGGSGL